MKTKQIQFDGVGQMRLVERELPPIKDKQLLVKVETCGLCTWERHIFAGTESMPFPFVGGHEIAGTIVEAGPAAPSHLKPGTPVAVAKWKRCNECEPCRRGYDNHCEANSGPSEAEYSGPAGFAEYLICESYEAYPYPADRPIEYAALGEPTACVTRGINRMRELVPGDTVAVVGAGIMGLLFLKLLKLRGMNVIVVQRSKGRRDLAAAMGADHVVDPGAPLSDGQVSWVRQILDLTDGRGAAGVVYTAGGSHVANECLEAARIGGYVLFYAPVLEGMPALDPDLIHFKELMVTGALQHDKESFRQAIRLLGSGQLDVSGLKLVPGSFYDFENEMNRADSDRSIHRILLRWD